MKARPLAIAATARVAIKEGTFNTVTTSPFSTPKPSPTPIPASAARPGWLPRCTSTPVVTAASEQTLAKDRSSSAAIKASEKPMPRMATWLMCLAIPTRLPGARKFRAAMAKNTNKATAANAVP